jgi:hypothetical protein
MVIKWLTVKKCLVRKCLQQRLALSAKRWARSLAVVKSNRRWR